MTPFLAHLVDVGLGRCGGVSIGDDEQTRQSYGCNMSSIRYTMVFHSLHPISIAFPAAHKPPSAADSAIPH
jgi:hypothetical protein